MTAVATGKTTPIKLFSRTPVPRLAARTNAQKRGCDSSSSRARRNAHIANAITSVSVTSGMTIRVKRNRPTHVAVHKPAYNPALCPNAQTPNAYVRHASPIAESAKGIRAAQS